MRLINWLYFGLWVLLIWFSLFILFIFCLFFVFVFVLLVICRLGATRINLRN